VTCEMANCGDQEDNENSKWGSVEPIPDCLRAFAHVGKVSEIFI